MTCSGLRMPSRKRHQQSLTLRDEITDEMVGGSFDRDKFLPVTSISSLITSEKIKEHLGMKGKIKPKQQDLLEFISKKATKVFRIVVATIPLSGARLLRVMKKFKESNFTDRRLPIESFKCAQLKPGEECSHDSWLEAFHEHPWSLADMNEFCKKQ